MIDQPKPVIGVLALQGAFREHRQMLESLGAKVIEVRLPQDLDGLHGLIIPGGESTTIGKLMVRWNMLDPIIERTKAGMAVWGTCAGAIVLAQHIEERGNTMDQHRLGLLDMQVKRNSFGRQVDSFEAPIDLSALGLDTPFTGVFIRAPSFAQVGKDLNIVATFEEHVVFVTHKNLWASSFHPELTDDSRLHQAFIDMAMNKK